MWLSGFLPALPPCGPHSDLNMECVQRPRGGIRFYELFVGMKGSQRENWDESITGL